MHAWLRLFTPLVMPEPNQPVDHLEVLSDVPLNSESNDRFQGPFAGPTGWTELAVAIVGATVVVVVGATVVVVVGATVVVVVGATVVVVVGATVVVVTPRFGLREYSRAEYRVDVRTSPSGPNLETKVEAEILNACAA